VALAVTVAGGVAAPGSVALADDDSGITVANVAVPLGITLTGLTQSFTLAGSPGTTVTEIGSVTFNVETNNPAGYVVTVISESPVLAPQTQDNPDSIPVDVVTVRETGGATFSPLSDAAPVVVHTQSARSADGGDDLSNDYRLRVPVVNEDTYSATLDYIATTL
jgi:hypothetical protein